jgi:hypothetical protein
VLHRYRRAGEFPRNSRHLDQRRPYFIDDDGRPCAVGALIQRSGNAELAERIDRTFHNDYVLDMNDPERWLTPRRFCPPRGRDRRAG